MQVTKKIIFTINLTIKKSIMETISLLLEHGFTQTGVNEFSKGKRYKAVLWKNGSVTIIQYTPKVKRLLYSTTFDNYKYLQSELIKNHS